MSKLPLAAFVLLSTSVQAAETLCDSDEHVYFSCSIAQSSKIASVCGSRNLTAKQGYLQYRFGRPGKVEFSFPSKKTEEKASFRWESGIHHDVSDDWLSFKNGHYTYSVFSIEDQDNPNRSVVYRFGVIVEKDIKGDQGHTLNCAAPASGDFRALADIVQWKDDEKAKSPNITVERDASPQGGSRPSPQR